MTRGAGPHPRCGGGLLRVLLLTSAALVWAPVIADAQQHEQIVSLRQGEYNSAFDLHQARMGAWSNQQQRRLALLDSLPAVKRSGNADRLDRAYQNLTAASVELTRLMGLATQTQRVLDEARRALQAALTDWADALEAQMSSASAVRQMTLAQQIDGLLAQIQDLQPAPSTTFDYLPVAAPEPTDGRDEIEFKILLIDRRSAEAQEEIARVNDDITRLQRQLNIQRQFGDVSSNRDRFDAGPPGRVGRPLNPGQTGSSEPVAGPQSIQQVIQQLTTVRDELMLYERELRSRRATLQTRLGQMGGNLE